MSACPYCTELSPRDRACWAEGDRFVCTRKPGHDGPHVACGYDHQIETWEDPR